MRRSLNTSNVDLRRSKRRSAIRVTPEIKEAVLRLSAFKEITQVEICHRLGLSQSTVSRITRGIV
jgi:DNA-directed RNA polymerase specialized sigma subunit